jgi:hypothetical protein
MMMQSSISRPSWERSWMSAQLYLDQEPTYLDIVALVVVAALSEQSVSDNTTSIEHVKHGVGVLIVSKAQSSYVRNLPWKERQ